MADAVGHRSILKASPLLTEDFTIRQIFDYATPCTKPMDTRVSAHDLVEDLTLTYLSAQIRPYYRYLHPLVNLPHDLLNLSQRIPIP